MKDKTKKKKLTNGIIIGIIFSLIVGIIITINIVNKKETNKVVIYKNSHENYAWSPVSYGYIIYDDGTIEEYDDYNTDNEINTAIINKDELTQLKDLANSIEDEYKEGINPESVLNPNSLMGSMENMFDAGITIKQIYNSKEQKWIKLYKFGDTMGFNNNEETKGIIELTNQLYKKYLGQNT